ncbi:MAG: hypothetical protein LBF67_08760 [Prevotellaceae bacterium]|jgi:hypothetical protein|nr:hypothetical protein [Prevotellaceae bacterium]
MKQFFSIRFFLFLPLLLGVCSEAARACKPKFFNGIRLQEWNGFFDDEIVFEWNTSSGSFQTIQPPVPCSESCKPAQQQQAPVVAPCTTDSCKNTAYTYARVFGADSSSISSAAKAVALALSAKKEGKL